MKGVYPRSINGCLWLHETDWKDNTSSVKIALDTIKSMRASKVVTTQAVKDYCGVLEKARDSQASLTSVWSFQEGLLMGNESRLYATPTTAGTPATSFSTCLNFDHNGHSYDPTAGSPMVGDYVQDIMAHTTFLVVMLTHSLLLRARNTPLDFRATEFKK